MRQPDDWTPPHWIERLILGIFITVLVLAAVAMALFVHVGY